MVPTAQGAWGSTSNQSGIAAQARAIAVVDAATNWSPVVKCSAGSSRIRSKISRRSDVPSASPPSARYSAARDSTCASPMSWISWAVRPVVVK